MAKQSPVKSLEKTVTRDVFEHPRDLAHFYAERLEVSRTTANSYIRQLEAGGWIERSGSATRPIFGAGKRRRMVQTYKLKGLQEDVVWFQDFRPFFDLKENVRNIVIHGFTEMLNNAIDHSNGDSVFVWVSQDEENVTLLIGDNGIGIFKKISDALGLPDIRLSLLELAKGKFTTDPDNHSGQGVFFTSRMFDLFEIDANGLRFSHQETLENDWLHEITGQLDDKGTSVVMEISLNSDRLAGDIFDEHSHSDEDIGFSKTVVPMRMAKIGDEQLVSRSQAKRLIMRFEKFKTVVLDFNGVVEIGQAFADELFRVYGKNHPEVLLVPVNETEQVKKMRERALIPADNQGGEPSI
jgi:anti-sigma regulatory factor (Ser/Thr protein kinase)